MKNRATRNYVLCLMKNDVVSPEIFLPWSSYTLWWKEYERIIRKKIMGTCTNEGWPKWKGLWSLKQVVSVSSPCVCSKLSWESSPPWHLTVPRRISPGIKTQGHLGKPKKKKYGNLLYFIFHWLNEGSQLPKVFYWLPRDSLDLYIDQTFQYLCIVPALALKLVWYSEVISR